MDDEHFLAPFLEKKLPTLGLDAETYGPYLCGLLPSEELSLIGDDDDDGDKQGADDEEWEGVLELLQASSESHSDDLEAWQALKKDVLERYKKHLAEQKKRIAEEDEARRQEAVKARKIPIPEKKPEDANNTKKKASTMDEEAKKALLAQYAYETIDEADQGGDGGADRVNPNKEAAKQANAEGPKVDGRKQLVSTKQEEQKKTKEAKQDKIKMKEERRKRATKGERKR